MRVRVVVRVWQQQVVLVAQGAQGAAAVEPAGGLGNETQPVRPASHTLTRTRTCSYTHATCTATRTACAVCLTELRAVLCSLRPAAASAVRSVRPKPDCRGRTRPARWGGDTVYGANSPDVMR